MIAAVIGFVAAALELALAAWVFFVRPDDPTNRRLARWNLLLGSGTALAAWSLAGGPALGGAARASALVALIACPWAFIRLGALDGTEGRIERAAAWVVALAGAMLVVAMAAGTLTTAEAATAAVVLLVAAAGVVDIGARRRSDTSEMMQGRLRALRTATRLASAGALFAVATWSLVPPWRALLLATVAGAFGVLVCAILSVSVLRHQTLAFDGRLQVVAKSGLAATAVAVLFGMFSEGLENLVPISDFEAGLLTAGAISFLITPIENVTQRAARRLFPHPTDDDGRAAMYRAALEEAWDDGALSKRDRVFLESLRQRLAIDGKDARALETAVRKRLDV